MIEKISKKIVIYFLLLILAFVLSISLIFNSSVTLDVTEFVKIEYVTALFLILSILIALVLVFISDYLNKKITSERAFNIIFGILLVIYAIFSIIWVFKSQMIIVGDQDAIHKCATKWIENGIYSLRDNGYLERNPHQLGIVFLVKTVYGIIGVSNYKSIQILNILSIVSIIILLYKLMKKTNIFNRINRFLYLILTIGFIPLLLLSTFVYGDYIGLAFSVSGLYSIIVFKETKKKRYLFASIVFEMIAYTIKTNYIIFILGIIIYLFLELFKEIRENKCKKLNIIKKIVLIFCYLLVILLPFTVMKKVICNKLEYNSKKIAPSSMYLTIGMTEGTRANGWYNDYASLMGSDLENYDKEYKSIIKERVKYFISNPGYTLNFYLYKNISAWTDVTFQSVWYNYPLTLSNEEFNKLQDNSSSLFRSLYTGKLNLCIQIYQKALIIIIYIGTIYYIIKNKSNIDNKFLVLGIIFIGGFLFHNLWEVKSRYVIIYIILLVPLATIGMSSLINNIKGKNGVEK